MGAEALRGRLTGLAGLVALVALWWVASVTVLEGVRVPTPPGVLGSLVEDGWDYYSFQFGITIREAAVGFFWGNLLAVLLASLVLLAPVAEPLIMQLAVITYCIPVVAIAPVLFIVIGIPGPGEPSGTAIGLAALAVFFTTVVGSVLGFRSADRTSLDVVQVYGGSRLDQLRKVQLVAALPSILAALQIAAPAAFLGAILGEYTGGMDRGVGLSLIIAQQNVDVERAWGIGIVCALVAGTAYALIGLAGRLVAPWSSGTSA